MFSIVVLEFFSATLSYICCSCPSHSLFCASLSITLDANHWVNVLIQASFVFDCKLGDMVVFMNSDHYGKHVTLHQGKIESNR